jgi:hypothetical protein
VYNGVRWHILETLWLGNLGHASQKNTIRINSIYFAQLRNYQEKYRNWLVFRQILILFVDVFIYFGWLCHHQELH